MQTFVRIFLLGKYNIFYHERKHRPDDKSENAEKPHPGVNRKNCCKGVQPKLHADDFRLAELPREQAHAVKRQKPPPERGIVGKNGERCPGNQHRTCAENGHRVHNGGYKGEQQRIFNAQNYKADKQNGENQRADDKLRFNIAPCRAERRFFRAA